MMVHTPIAAALTLIRRAKTEAKVSQRAAVAQARISGPAAVLDAIRGAQTDLAAAGTVESMMWNEAAEFAVEVVLADSNA